MELNFFFGGVGNALYHIEMIGGFLVLMHLHELLVQQLSTCTLMFPVV